jgi:hypothetical protein
MHARSTLARIVATSCAAAVMQHAAATGPTHAPPYAVPVTQPAPPAETPAPAAKPPATPARDAAAPKGAPQRLPKAASAAPESKLPELNLTYRVTWNGIGLGDAKITLKPEGGADCYRYENATNPIGIVRAFYGTPHEVSNFCVRGGKVVPQKFQYIHDDDDSFSLDFDMAAGKVRDGKGNERDVPPNAQDRFGMHQAVRLWVMARVREKDPGAENFEIAQVDDRNVRKYILSITGRERVVVGAGTFDAILVQRIDDPKKVAKFWVAPELDYMPVKVVTMRPRANLEMELRREQ